MKFTNQLLYKHLQNIFGQSESLKIADKSDEKYIHRILESIGMNISKKIQVLYSRQPSLWESYSQAHQKPLFFLSKDRTSFLSVLSETEINFKNEKQTAYYISDLRTSKKTPIKIRIEFKKLYHEALKKIPDFLYTAIFNSNTIALRSLTAKRNKFKYNKLTEYISRTFFVLPGINFSSFKVIPVTPNNTADYISFSNKYKYDFAHINIYKDHYLITCEKKIIGCFSVVQPKNKCLLIDSSATWVNSLLYLNKLFKDKNHSSNLSWKYITHLQIAPGAFNKKFIRNFIRSLRKSKVVSIGQLVVMLYSTRFEPLNKQSLISGCPQFVNKTSLFQVELEENDRSIKGEILLDPNQL